MKEYNLKGAVTSLWWFPLVTGLIGIGLGIWVLAAPIASITTFAIAFAICIAIAGVVANNQYSRRFIGKCHITACAD